MQFQEIPYPPHGRSLEIPGGGGVSKAKDFKGKYEANWESPKGWVFFVGGGGAKQKTFLGEGMYLGLSAGAIVSCSWARYFILMVPL